MKVQHVLHPVLPNACAIVPSNSGALGAARCKLDASSWPASCSVAFPSVTNMSILCKTIV
eukprot:6403986-Amphidinium_carterae.1